MEESIKKPNLVLDRNRLQKIGNKLYIEGRYWNCGYHAIAIAASITKEIDWSAYIGATPSPDWSEMETVAYTLEHGCKLSEEEARFFFPSILLPYRH